MKKLTLVFTFVVLSMVVVVPTRATMKKLAQAGLNFLKIGIGARSEAMGGAFSMVGNDASAIFYNPAGIAKTHSRIDLFVSKVQWIADISYNAAALVGSLGNWGSVGVSLISSDYGDVIGTRFATNEQGFIETGKLGVGAFSVGLSYARELTDKFTVGLQVKYVAQHLGSNLLEVGGKTIENKVSGLAYDFGTMFYPGFKSFRFGMYIRNFSPQFKYQQTPFQLPLTFYIGSAIDILDFFGEHPGNSLVVDLDAIHPRDYTERIHLGCEYWFRNTIALRAGYKFNYDSEGLSAGFGFKLKGIKFDYAYSDSKKFNAVSRISIGVAF